MISEFQADLHCHTSFSDGTDTPEQLLQLCVEKGLSGLSITDHDTIAAYGEALESARQKKILLISGVEFSAVWGQEPVHILGYGYDLKSKAIAALCQRHKLRREERNEAILSKLRRLGIAIELDDLKSRIKGSLGRPHIAQVLLERNVVGSIQEAFERYLGEGKLAFAPGHPISVQETLDTIHQGKGLAVLAHPQLIKRSTTIRALLKMPFDGLEGHYARFSLEQEKKWLDLAAKNKWIVTGGSDYHGGTKPNSVLGSSWIGKETFDKLYSLFQVNNPIKI